MDWPAFTSGLAEISAAKIQAAAAIDAAKIQSAAMLYGAWLTFIGAAFVLIAAFVQIYFRGTDERAERKHDRILLRVRIKEFVESIDSLAVYADANMIGSNSPLPAIPPGPIARSEVEKFRSQGFTVYELAIRISTWLEAYEIFRNDLIANKLQTNQSSNKARLLYVANPDNFDRATLIYESIDQELDRFVAEIWQLRADLRFELDSPWLACFGWKSERRDLPPEMRAE